MPTCFVIQPFDGGPFDKRYEDTLRPAIVAAGLEPYRVDRDDSSVIPIEDIERGIRKADVCLADISTDNPNVWFEVGFAIATGKPIVLVCSSDRQKFPFDVQHRSIIRYKTESRNDFSVLAEQVTKRLRIAIEKQNELTRIEDISPIANAEGLSAHEMVALVLVAQNLDGTAAAHSILQDMDRAGYTEIAVALALRSLANRQYVESSTASDYNGNEYSVYSPTPAGFRWLDANQSKLTLRREPKPIADVITDSEHIPF